MYRDEILDLYKHPLNQGKLDDAEFVEEGENPSCGDETTVYLELEEKKVKQMKHDTEACAICTASLSILSEEVEGMKAKEIINLDSDWMLENLGIDVSPMRLKCAVLGLKTVQKALD